MNYKRLTIICGHYGSGKTNIAVNAALELRKTKQNVAAADLDIVNPYFRTKDSSKELNEAGIRLICSEFANTNLDLPSLPDDLYTITDDKTLSVILDIGGDDRGAYVLGRLAPAILEENDYEMLLVVNKYRPLTPDVSSTLEVKAEIERACGIPFTGIINNSNLGCETKAEDVLDSVQYAQEISKATGLPCVMTSVDEKLFGELYGNIPNIFPMKLQKRQTDI